MSKARFEYEARCPLRHLLRRALRSVDAARRVEDLAAVFISYPVGRGRSSLCGLPGSHLLDCDPRQHGARIDRLRHLGRARNDPRAWGREQQIFGRNHGRIARQSAESAQYLLVASGPALVRTQSECHSLRRSDGIVTFRYARHGRWPQANAQDIWPGRTQPWRQRIQAVLVRTAASESPVHRLWTQAGMGLCVAIAHHRRNALSEPWPWPGADDGTRLE